MGADTSRCVNHPDREIARALRSTHTALCDDCYVISRAAMFAADRARSQDRHFRILDPIAYTPGQPDYVVVSEHPDRADAEARCMTAVGQIVVEWTGIAWPDDHRLIVNWHIGLPVYINSLKEKWGSIAAG
jgi:hypothetical protein